MSITLDKFYENITPGYIEERINEINALTELVEKNCFDELEAKFHRIAGSGGGFGLSQVTEIASLIEKAAENRDRESVKAEFEKYIKFLKVVKVSFR